MKRNALLLLLIVLLGLFGFKTLRDKIGSDFAQPVFSPSVTPTPVYEVKGIDTPRKTSLFVPYWSSGTDQLNTGEYDSYLYFGIAAAEDGINMDEAGANGLSSFVESVPEGAKTYLVVRMLDKDIVSETLKDTNLQQKVISQSLNIASENGFDGVVLDLEISALPLESLIKQITAFNAQFYLKSKASQLSYGMTLYGDTFYRIRPFDIKALSKQADMFYIMAYDFHKAKGNPGPNFPLGGSGIYGYDMHAMSDNFLRYLPAEKVTMIFGLYGYDWEVDGKGNAVSQAEALSYRKIQSKFLQDCGYKNCKISRDNQSTETKITYIDEDGKNHIVWFEDMQSVAEKEKMLHKKGISSFSFWANGYF